MTQQGYFGTRGTVIWNAATLEVTLNGKVVGLAGTWNEALEVAGM